MSSFPFGTPSLLLISNTDPKSRPNTAAHPHARQPSSLPGPKRHPNDNHHFTVVEHALSATPLRIWREALAAVDRGRPTPPLDQVMPYWLPDPELSANAHPDRQWKYIKHWLMVRELWLSLVGREMVHPGTTGARAVRAKDWRYLLDLGPFFSAPDDSQQTFTAQSKRHVSRLFEDMFGAANMREPANDPSWNSIPIAELIPQQAKEISWELAQVAFRMELLVLDRLMMSGRTGGDAQMDEAQRQLFVSMIFDGEPVLRAAPQTSNRGLACPKHEVRARSVDALCRLLARWPNVPADICTASIRCPDPPVTEVARLERLAASFYLQSFWERCGRAATIPREFPSAL